MSGLEIAELAKESLMVLTGFDCDTVSSMAWDAEGWHVSVDMVELRRIPQVSDVLATYETVLDEEGNLVRYERTRRYQRGQLHESE